MINGSFQKMKTALCITICILASVTMAGQKPSLAMASRQGDMALVKALVADGQAINPTNRYAFTPLQLACKAGALDVAEFLLQSGADANRGIGDSPLHIAISTGNKDLVHVILEHNPDIEAKTARTEHTPLHYAAIYEDFEAATNLIGKGAYLWARDWHNNTPYDLAKKGSFTNLINILPEPLEHTVTPDDIADCVVLPISTNQYHVHMPQHGLFLVDSIPSLHDVILRKSTNRRLAVVKRSLYGKNNKTDLEPILRRLDFRIVKKEWSGAYGQKKGLLYLPFTYVASVVTNGASQSDVQRMLGGEKWNEITMDMKDGDLVPAMEVLNYQCCDGPIHIRLEDRKVTAIERGKSE